MGAGGGGVLVAIALCTVQRACVLAQGRAAHDSVKTPQQLLFTCFGPWAMFRLPRKHRRILDHTTGHKALK